MKKQIDYQYITLDLKAEINEEASLEIDPLIFTKLDTGVKYMLNQIIEKAEPNFFQSREQQYIELGNLIHTLHDEIRFMRNCYGNIIIFSRYLKQLTNILEIWAALYVDIRNDHTFRNFNIG